MAGVYDDQILGAKQQAETLQRIRDEALGMSAPQGRMVGNYYVAPHWTQNLAHMLRNISAQNQAEDANTKAEELTRQKNIATIQAMNSAGMQAPDALIQAVNAPRKDPSVLGRVASFLRGEEPQDQQSFQQKVMQNVSPEQKEAALMQLHSINPDVGKPIMDYMAQKQKQVQADADRDESRKLREDIFYSKYGVMPGDSGAVVGNRIINGNGDVTTLARSGGSTSAGGSGAGGVDRRDITIQKMGDGRIYRINKRTGEATLVDAEGNVPKQAQEKPLTESQANANLFSGRMEESDKILNDLGDAYSPVKINAARSVEKVPGLGWGANALLDDKDQSALQAQRDFLNAALRKESGASISPSEIDNGNRQYFPQPGDKPAVIVQKAKNRELAITKMKEGVPQQQPPSGFKLLGVE